LFQQQLMELPFAGGHEPAISIGIDEGIEPGAGLQPRALFFQTKESAVCAEKDVAGQLLEPREGMLVVGYDLRVGLVIDQSVPRWRRRAAEKDHVVFSAAFAGRHGPGGAAGSVSRREDRAQRHATKLHGLAVMNDLVHYHGGGGRV